MSKQSSPVGEPSTSGSVQGDVVDPMACLARTASGEFTGEGMLQELCRVAGSAVDVSGVGVMKVDAERVSFVHADSGIVEVEQLQEQFQRGPCIESVSGRAPVIVPDVSVAPRWPEFRAASGRAGIQSMVAMPLLARGCGWGVLDLYRSTSAPWTARDLAAARTLADVTASYIAMAADRDLARVARRELEHRATHDELTGLPNRALLFDRVEHAVVGAERLGTAVAVLLLDIDRFKEVNDSLGHPAGDVVLVEVSRRLKAVLREMDTLARLSGDEFVVVCEDLSGTEDEINDWMAGLVDRLQTAVSRPLSVDDRCLVVSVSVGSTAASDRQSAQELIGRADRAMYAAKSASRGLLIRRRNRPC